MDAGEVHVWNVAVTPEAVLAAVPLLNSEERARADRFLVEHARASYTTTRGTLRRLAGDYLQIDPRLLEFEQGPFGKPFLPAFPHLGFNVSHSGTMAVLAFAWDLELGVDVEQIRRPVTDVWAIARRFFAPPEVEDLRRAGSDPDDLAEAFFRCWTRKEAYIKAVGEGLNIPLDSFRVSLLSDEEPAVLSAEGWSMHSWQPGIGYAGALTYRGSARRVVFNASPEWPTNI
jgi:4'-phosphopantetheinyl transferase